MMQNKKETKITLCDTLSTVYTVAWGEILIAGKNSREGVACYKNSWQELKLEGIFSYQSFWKNFKLTIRQLSY